MGIMQQSWREHRGLLIIACLYFLSVSVVALYIGARPAEFFILIAALKMAVLSLVLFFGVAIATTYGHALLQTSFKAHKGFASYIAAVSALFNTCIDSWLKGPRLVRGAAGLVPVLIILSSVCIAKSLIFWISSYQWDPFFSALDYKFHFNHYPYEAFVALAQTVPIAAFLNFIYVLWFVVMFMMCGVCLFCDNDHVRRMRYLWTFIICWIVIGTVLATIFASGGPIYFDHFHPNMINPYQSLIAHLRDVSKETPLNVIEMSPVLLQITIDKNVIGANGISAMPSMHIAIAWLMVLYAWSFRRCYGLAMLAYFILIFAGSVYLGWHYAIDGYASVIITTLIWWMVGKRLSAKAGTAIV